MTQPTIGVSDDSSFAYTVAEARQKVPMGRNTFYAAIKKGDIPSLRIGGKILVPKGPFDRMFGCDAA